MKSRTPTHLVFLLLFCTGIFETTKLHARYVSDNIDDSDVDDTTDAMTSREKNTDKEEGDMKLTPEEELAAKGIIPMSDMSLEDLSKWPSTSIPYVFAPGFGKKIYCIFRLLIYYFIKLGVCL